MSWSQFSRLLRGLGLEAVRSEFSESVSPAVRVLTLENLLIAACIDEQAVSDALNSLFLSHTAPYRPSRGMVADSEIGAVLDRLNQLEAKLEDRHRLLTSQLGEFRKNCCPKDSSAGDKANPVATKARNTPFDLFLSYNAEDRATVLLFRELLKEVGVYGWMDVHDIGLGSNDQAQLDAALLNCRGGVIFLGAGGIGRWQQLEIRSLVNRYGRKGEGPLVLVIIHPKAAMPPTLEGLPRIMLSDEKEPLAAAQRIADALQNSH
ncbi:MAG: sulfatase-modifying factor protein [Limisphaerales bacterium]|nr:MAG: sulfatase-modifying factor protein [Limisphaerales bacterium]KAG0510228.1 MAG: sulfatase-modifying factor protein [Limisphaerales bacterium]TXT51889.1 MAG: sulfatase-modifying factor protein [Limisphaerales bacterium]